MKLHFISKTTDRLRRIFSKKPLPSAMTEEIANETGKAAKNRSRRSSQSSVKSISEESHYVKQLRYLLIKNGKATGKPFKKKTPEIRIIDVDNFTGAFIYFLHLCDQRLLTYQVTGSHLYCLAEFPDGSGKLSFTDHAKCRNKSVVAVLKIEAETLKPKICEIRFEVKQLK